MHNVALDKPGGIVAVENDRQMARMLRRQRLEEGRLSAVRCYGGIGGKPNAALDALVDEAVKRFNVPIALVSIVDRTKQHFRSRKGLDADETPRIVSFCSHAIEQDDVFIIPDATRDPRFEDNPLVIGAPGIRFYAGALLVAPGDEKIGTLCIIDEKPRASFGARDRRDLVLLAEEAMEALARQAVADAISVWP